MELPDEVMERRQKGRHFGHNIGEVEYRIARAKSYLKRAGYLTQSARGIWALTPEGKATDTIDERAIVSEVQKAGRARRKAKQKEQ
jgi:restriction system protein